jgi:hypothetical protein
MIFSSPHYQMPPDFSRRLPLADAADAVFAATIDAFADVFSMTPLAIIFIEVSRAVIRLRLRRRQRCRCLCRHVEEAHDATISFLVTLFSRRHFQLIIYFLQPIFISFH